MRPQVRRWVLCGIVVATAVGLIACEREAGGPGAGAAPAWREVSDDQLTPVQRGARDTAMAAIVDLQQTLLAQVSTSMQEHGAAGTIAVCRDLAPRLAEQVGQQHGVRVGRTSHRLRNPENAGPVWMSAVVDARRDEVVTLVGAGGAVRLAMPIHVAAPCLGCHGRTEVLAPEVARALGEQYPHDAATGFAEGDLRGWFWVETMETP